MKDFAPNVLGLKVQTADGYKHFEGVAYMGDRPIYRVEFTNGRHLEATGNHRLISPSGVFSLDEIQIGTQVFTGAARRTRVKSVVDTGRVEAVYDLVGVEGGSTYLTNGVLSHNCDFVTDDETLINPLTLAGMKGVKPEFYTGTVRWYKDPSPNKTYCVALDPSLGTGRDYAAIQVFELPDMIQVAEWQHNMTAPRGQISNLLKMLMFIDQTLRDDIRQQGEPEIFWTVENNTLGEAVLQIIEDTGEERFPGIFVSEKKKKGASRRFRKGLNTDNKKKLSACARFKSLVESGRMLLNSDQLIKELKLFVASASSFAAKPGGHDDLVSATLLIVRMLETVLNWSNASGDLREHIGEDELFEDESEAMPVVI